MSVTSTSRCARQTSCRPRCGTRTPRAPCSADRPSSTCALAVYGNLTYGPLFKTWYDTNGKEGVEPPDPWKKIVEYQDEAKAANPERQAEIAQEIYKLWVDNLYDIGTIGLTAMDQGVAVVNAKLRNVPENLTKDWALRTPGNGKPETWFFAE